MRVNLAESLPRTITIINRRTAKEAGTTEDVLYHTIVESCLWETNIDKDRSTKQASITPSFTIQIPKDPRYKPHRQWSFQPTGFTVNVGDVIILGNVTPPINVETLSAIKEKHYPNACMVTGFRDATTDGVTASGAMGKYTQCYIVTGS